MIYTEILGNIAEEKWAELYAASAVEHITLDQWAAQRSRLKAVGDRGNEYAIALKRRTTLRDGDVVSYNAEERQMVVIRLRLNDILEIDLGALANMDSETIISTAVELGHAIGNQHWPAVVKDTRVFVPMTLDRKVMESVMRTHSFENVSIAFRRGAEIIPYLAPHEVRRLFGGTDPATAEHAHHHHPAK